MKNREQKQVIIETLKRRFESAVGVVLAGYKGMTVSAMSQLRNELRPVGGKFTVLKNTLARIAAKGTPYEDLVANLEGPTAAAFLESDPAAGLKVLFKLGKDFAALDLQKGFIEGVTLDKQGLKSYSELPTKDEVGAIFLGVLQAPMSQLLSVLDAPARDLVGVMRAYADKLENGVS